MTIALEPRTRRPQFLAAAATIIGAAVTAVYGAYGDPHPSAEQEHTVPVVIGAAVVIALLVFGLLVPWAARTGKRAAGWGLGLAIVAVILIPATFWSGVPLIAAAAAVLGVAGRRLGGGGLARAAIVVAVIAMIGSTALVVLGNTVLA
jgi:uncharacterized membrane protein YhaH (DUF805 family)